MDRIFIKMQTSEEQGYTKWQYDNLLSKISGVDLMLFSYVVLSNKQIQKHPNRPALMLLNKEPAD